MARRGLFRFYASTLCHRIIVTGYGQGRLKPLIVAMDTMEPDADMRAIDSMAPSSWFPCQKAECDDLIAMAFGLREAWCDGATLHEVEWRTILSGLVARSDEVCGQCAAPMIAEACEGLEHHEPFAWMLTQIDDEVLYAASVRP